MTNGLNPVLYLITSLVALGKKGLLAGMPMEFHTGSGWTSRVGMELSIPLLPVPSRLVLSYVVLYCKLLWNYKAGLNQHETV